MLRSNAVDILRLIIVTHIQTVRTALTEADKQELKILFEQTGFNEAIYTCSTTVQFPFRYYLVVASSTENFFRSDFD